MVMPYKTKTQKKRALIAIKAKAFKLSRHRYGSTKGVMMAKDWMAIEKICDKYLNKLQ